MANAKTSSGFEGHFSGSKSFQLPRTIFGKLTLPAISTVRLGIERLGYSARHRRCYYGSLIGSHSLELHHFRWPWATFKSFAYCKPFQMRTLYNAVT